MKILHVIDAMNLYQGGPSVSVPRLAEAQAKLGHRVTIACRDYAYLGPMGKAEGVEVRSIPSNRWTKGQGGWGCSFRRLVEKEAEKADVIHNHGVWLAANYYARRAAVKAGKPLVVSPRGMLEGWSLGRARIKKTVAWHLFEKRNLESAALFHATSDSEAEAIAAALCSKLKFKNKEGSAKGDRRKEIGPLKPSPAHPNKSLREIEEERFRAGIVDRETDNPPNSYLLSANSSGVPRIVVAPNGVDVPEKIPGREVVERRFPELKGKKWVLFMSRIHPKKGLDLLLKAWNERLRDEGQAGGGRREEGYGLQATGDRNDPSSISQLPSAASAPMLVIAGADLVGYGAEVRRMIREMGLEGGVVMTGHVEGEVREALLGQAEFMVLPSHSENFGLVVAESLAAGRPVVTTKGTPWGSELALGDRRKEIGDRGTMNLEERKCGVICEVTDLKRGLERMLGYTDKERTEMGARGREWMKREFSWGAGAEKLLSAYREVVR